jgi:maltokinase
VISSTTLANRLADYLPRQRWFGAKDRTIELVRVVECEVLQEGWPALLRVEAEVVLGEQSDASETESALDEEVAVENETARYQLLLGLRPTGLACEFLTGHEHAVLGEFETEQGQALGYDALLDAELALALLAVVAPDRPAERVRPVGAEQSNTSLVYDDAMILKVFRHLTDGPNPEVEVTQALVKRGFTAVAEPLASWRKDGRDLALLQRFLAGGTEGWAMALTSLRELYAEPGDPAESGGDFGAEAERLGEVTADLHLALADAFGRHKADANECADLMERQVRRVLSDPGSQELAKGSIRIIARLREVSDPGPAIRVHGDYHLGQVMRTATGWYILDFEGEPARPLRERIRPSSPLKDVAGMLRSFHYAPVVAMATQEDDMTEAARAWEARNRGCFLAGYLRRSVEAGGEDGSVLPTDPAARSAVLTAFELDKAVYEVAYERAHRPDWAFIPLEAVRRLTEELGVPGRTRSGV